jgi:hypothetical protein
MPAAETPDAHCAFGSARPAVRGFTYRPSSAQDLNDGDCSLGSLLTRCRSRNRPAARANRARAFRRHTHQPSRRDRARPDAGKPLPGFKCRERAAPSRPRRSLLAKRPILQGRESVELTATRLTELDLPLDWTEQQDNRTAICHWPCAHGTRRVTKPPTQH